MNKVLSLAAAALIAAFGVATATAQAFAECLPRADFLEISAQKNGEILLGSGIITETMKNPQVGSLLLATLFGEQGMEKGDLFLVLASQPWNKEGPWSAHSRKPTGRTCSIGSGDESWKSFRESMDFKVGHGDDNGFMVVVDEESGNWRIMGFFGHMELGTTIARGIGWMTPTEKERAVNALKLGIKGGI